MSLDLPILFKFCMNESVNSQHEDISFCRSKTGSFGSFPTLILDRCKSNAATFDVDSDVSPDAGTTGFG